MRFLQEGLGRVASDYFTHGRGGRDVSGQFGQEHFGDLDDRFLRPDNLGLATSVKHLLVVGGAVSHTVDQGEFAFNLSASRPVRERPTQNRDPQRLLVCGVGEVPPEPERQLSDHLPRRW